jgi:propanol-preferring alcohol dehydrogenase
MKHKRNNGMLAARFKGSGKPFAVEDVEVPDVGYGEVMVELKAAGICGTDVHYRRGEFEPTRIPLILGHEGAGVVRKVGDNVTNVKEGDNVIVHYVVSCGQCKPCLQGYDNRCHYRKSIGHDLDGTFAQYIRIPANNATKVASHVPFEWGAVTGCAVSTAYHAVTVSGMKKGDTVIIFGAGGVGLHAVMWARFFGAGKVMAVDLIDSKLETAEKYGADVLLNPSSKDVLKVVERETDGWGADVAIECSGSSKAMEQAIKAIKGKNMFESGKVVSVGLQTKPFQADFWGLREGCIGVSGDHTRFDLLQIVKLIESGRVDLSGSVTHRFSLEDVNEGVEVVESGKGHVERVVINKFVR